MALRVLACLLLWGWIPTLWAAVAVPDPLKPWQDWVLHDANESACPFYFQNFKYTQCAWPGLLSLRVDAAGMTFTQTWDLYAEGELPLPGSDGFWPVDVSASGVSVPVVARDGRPIVHLKPGRYAVSGSIPFQQVPESLLIPRQTALIKLWRNGVLDNRPQLDADGRLWLVARQPVVESDTGASSEDKLSLRVFRYLQDDIPFRMETRVELEVSGKPREMLLGKVLFDQFVPELFDSPLPARIEADGRLRVQLRPGQWTVRLQAHRNGSVTEVALEKGGDGFWPEEEVWVFEPIPSLRQVRIEGAESIDPNQTALPAEWRSYPAYRLQNGDQLQVAELRRGDPQPSPNQLQLSRTFWLDFAGGGMTVEDHLHGFLYRDWRLTASPALALGSLQLNGQAQVITRQGDTQGVEVRQGQLDARALSRIVAGDSVHRRTLSSTGWLHDVDSLSARVQLPPGWRVFTVAGVDIADNTWTGTWSVWDIFIVLIAIAAVVRLRGIVAGIICALALLLIYPEAPAFLYLWLNVIAVMALLFLLPEGKLRRFFNLYGTGAALVLALWLIGFMVEQARLGLYPQLYQSWKQMGADDYYYSSVEEAYPAAAAAPMMDLQQEAAPVERRKLASTAVGSAAQVAAPRIERMDPNLAAQTGPGKPNWEWVETRLQWSGPVTQNETFDLYLLTPLENRLLAWLRVLLGVLMLLSVVGIRKQDGRWQLQSWRRRVAQPAVLLLALLAGWGGSVNDAQAALPDKELLTELQQRLLQERDCTPACLGIERLHIDVAGQRLTLRYRLHSREQVYWPLPDSQHQWQIDAVLLNGESHSLRKPEKADGQLQITVPAGQHDLQITGAVSQRGFQLTFPVMPHNISVQAPGWEVRGIDNGRLLANGIYFEPQASAASAQPATAEQQLTADPVPAFVRVQRELRLGLNWYLETRVERVAPQQGGITLDIPLLPGESVTSQTLEVVAGKARVNLKPGQQSLQWFSALDKSSQLQLQADASGQWSEHWILDPSPLWHVETDGIAPVKETGVVSQWKPQWRPYPGEQLTLHIQRPEAVAGATTTIDQVIQTVTPGQRETQQQLRFHLISSKGSEQRIDLPAGARVKSVLVDGEARAVDEDSQRIILPVNPGQHWVEVEWRETADMGTRVRTPAVDLNAPYVNHSIRLQVPAGRWVLFAGGPAMGPAVLFWGVLIVTLIIAVGLGRLRHLPLNTGHWLLLVLGLCAGWIQLMIPLVAWFVLLQWRSQLDPQRLSRIRFNLLQLALAALSLFTLLALIAAIPNGLLGSPDMGVTGNGSSAYQLNWFVDRGDSALTQAWMISIPLWIYRALMLVWSLWLALKLLGWLKWGWLAFTHEGYWRSDRITRPEATQDS
ncbi:MAG: hypothetical protein R3F38_16940 [Gammaproteobacteria bacterium]